MRKIKNILQKIWNCFWFKNLEKEWKASEYEEELFFKSFGIEYKKKKEYIMFDKEQSESLNRRLVEESSRIYQAINLMENRISKINYNGGPYTLEYADTLTDWTKRGIIKDLVEFRDDLLIALATNPSREIKKTEKIDYSEPLRKGDTVSYFISEEIANEIWKKYNKSYAKGDEFEMTVMDIFNDEKSPATINGIIGIGLNETLFISKVPQDNYLKFKALLNPDEDISTPNGTWKVRLNK